MKHTFLLIIALFIIYNLGKAQSKAPIFTADSIESGNSKDILTNFFQFAFNNLTSQNRELNFSSNPYALMLKRNSAYSSETMYKRNRPLRKLNISFGVKLDSSFYFNGFSSGIKYALIDKTDITTSTIFRERAMFDALNNERDSLLHYASLYVRTAPISDAKKEAFTLEFAKLDGDVLFKNLSTEFKKVIMEIVEERGLKKIKDVFENKPDSSFKQIDLAKFESLKNSMKKNLLWTIGISDTTYKDKFQFANISLTTEISKGLFEPERGDNNIEFTAKAAYNFLNDTLREGRNLKREIFTAEAGFNWIIRDRSTDKSFLETKFSGTFYHNFASLYNGENRDSLTLNGTLRFRLMDDIWIPLEIKYDPKSGNIFGFLNIKANFTGLGKLLKKQT